MSNEEMNTASCQTAVGRRLLFYNDSQRQPKQNQRVLLYVANKKENWLSQLRYTTAVYQHDTKTGKDVYVLDAGGSLSGMDVIWSELPFIEQEQIDKILGVLPF
jgi:hypothetical protein